VTKGKLMAGGFKGETFPRTMSLQPVLQGSRMHECVKWK